MTIRHVIYTQVPGIDGTGITSIEKTQLLQDVAKVAPPSAGTLGQVLQHGMSGPEWQDKAIYDVRDLVSDTTGATVMTSQLQSAIDALPEGAVLDVPADVILNLDDTIMVNKELHLQGYGELRWTAGVAAKRALQLQGHGSSVRNVRITNPNKLFSHEGGRNLALDVRANNVTIQGVFFKNWQNSIMQEADGEYHGLVVDGNVLMDCIGTAGSLDNKGDGIAAFGSGAIITNNIINALVGEDARCGIVVEGLPPYITNHLTSNATNIDDTGFIVTGNIITGPFRRSIHAEGVYDYIISDNVCMGARWWGMMLWGGDRGTVSNNHITWTENGTPGGNTSIRTPLYVQQAKRVRIDGNMIRIASGTTWSAGMYINNPLMENGEISYEISDNTIMNESTGAGHAIRIENINGGLVGIKGNRVGGPFTHGVYVYALTADSDFIIGGNEIVGTTGRSINLLKPRRAVIHDNYIESTTDKIAVENGTIMIAKHNTIIGAGIGVYAWSTPSYAPNNTYIDVTTKASGVTSTTAYGPA